MSDFKREERYIVVKLKDIDDTQEASLRIGLCNLNISTRECVVVEPDWPNYADTWAAIEQVAGGEYKSPQQRIAELEQQVQELQQEALPNEHGTNRYGLDVAYFRNTINRELNHSLANFKPDELARVLARLSRTADKEVMFEPEFAAEHDAEVAARAVEEIKNIIETMFETGEYEQLKRKAFRQANSRPQGQQVRAHNDPEWCGIFAAINHANQLRDQGNG